MRARLLPVLGLCLALGLAACSSPDFIDIPNPVTGKVTGVQQGSFELTISDGSRFRFLLPDPIRAGLGSTEVEAIGHLRQHQISDDPVGVRWRRDGYELVAVAVDDG